MTITAKVGRRGQIILPKEVRERLHVEEGQRVAFVMKGGEVTLQPLTTTLLDHRGAVKVAGPQDFDAVRAAVRKARGERAARDE